MGKSERVKGHSFEREIAIALRRFFPKCKRHLEVQKCEALGFDLDHTGPFRFQLKRLKKWAPITCIEEVVPAPGIIPALITKGDHKPAVVCLYFEDFLKLLGDIGEAFVDVEPVTIDDF